MESLQSRVQYDRKWRERGARSWTSLKEVGGRIWASNQIWLNRRCHKKVIRGTTIELDELTMPIAFEYERLFNFFLLVWFSGSCVSQL